MANKPKDDATQAEPNAEFDSSKLNIYQKLAAITGEVGAIAKDGKNKEQYYNFIEYAAVAGKLRVLFAKYGVVIVPNMAKGADQKRETFNTKKGGIGVNALIDFEFTVVNADKPEDCFVVTWVGEATDYGDKATNKAATAALKYYLMRQFNISEKGEDADEQTIERASHSNAPATEVSVQPVEDKPISAPQIKYLSQILIRKKVATPQERMAIVAVTQGYELDKVASFDIRNITSKEASALIEDLNNTSTEALLERIKGFDPTSVTDGVDAPAPDEAPQTVLNDELPVEPLEQGGLGV